MTDFNTKKRWWLKACLTTVSPLHVGGELFETKLSQKEELTEINGVVTDCDGRAYIPGSTIKGNMRAWLEKNIVGGEDIAAELFGEDSVTEESGKGGKAEFWDARIISPIVPESHIPHWNLQRQTGIEQSVVIDRRNGTAAQSLLHTMEYVPPGVTFRMIITGVGLTPKEIACLQTILESCSGAANTEKTKCLRFGSSSSNSYGRMKLNISCVRATNRKSVDNWLEADCPGSWTDCLEPLDNMLTKEIETAQNSLTILQQDRIRITLKLSFSGPFLINDPTREVMVKDADDDGKARKLDHVPLLDGQGNIVLPPKSFRGALRSQAEKIVRTMGGRCCRPDIAEERCPAIHKEKEADSLLCPVCRIFGAGGWGAPLAIEQIELNGTPSQVVRQFIAIDRFTGGNADGAKFDAKVAIKPEFTITLSLDYRRLDTRSIALLALLWRDLYEGDIRFGMDKGIGFGACRAVIGSVYSPLDTADSEHEDMEPENEYKKIHALIIEDSLNKVVSKELQEIVTSAMAILNSLPDVAEMEEIV